MREARPACLVFLLEAWLKIMAYRRYSIHSQPSPNITGHPSRFRVEVSRPQLARLLLLEALHYRGNLNVVLSRPCIYGVFSGPVGGFAPRHHLCVGCLRCMVEFPEIVQIHPNPARLRLGDSYFTPGQVDTVLYEASSGRIPVKGAGYRGRFGGKGWDGMWTDMSEIVRPTRDGIHGREYISTVVHLGAKPRALAFDRQGYPLEGPLHLVTLPIPILFDAPPAQADRRVLRAQLRASEMLSTLCIVPGDRLGEFDSQALVPLVEPGEIGSLEGLAGPPRMIELSGWDEVAFEQLRNGWPNSLICIRLPMGSDLIPLIRAGVSTFHLAANYHGEASGHFALDSIRHTHEALVAAGVREQVSLLGSGGIIAAEHLAKAMICGLDSVALDTPAWIALQARFVGEVTQRSGAQMQFPEFELEWGAQRLLNLVASWRDQLLEVLGAMGLREVQRLRGEMGRALFQRDLEREAFADIPGIGEAYG